MKISKEIKIGILVAVSIAILLIGFNWLKGVNVFNKGTMYSVEYENANGLQVGDAVLVNGLKVGKVKEIALSENKTGVEVTLNLETDVPLPTDSKAMVSGDLLGERYIQLMLGSSTQIANEGAKLQGEVEVNVMNQIKALSGKINVMISSIDTTINVLSGIFTENLKDDFAKSITGIKNTLESFNRSAAKFNEILSREEPKIETIISNVSNVTDYVNKSETEVKAILDNLKNLTDTLNSVQWNELAIELDTAVHNINILTQKINGGDGTLGMLVNNEELYRQLNSTLATLDSVLAVFGKNPEIKLRLFGKDK